MKFLRKRIFSVFLLIVFLQSLLLPNMSFALTSGPHQPEHTSYQEPGGTDMVNLLTGDFAMSLPLLEVPGPEGQFSLPLSYSSGISPDQEASWVGLGWNMNPGAIVRHVSGYPDDASGEVNSISVKDLEGIYGAELNTYVVGSFGINNVQGHYGALSLFDIVNVSYSNGEVNSVGIVGIKVSDGGKVDFDYRQFIMACVTIASFGAAGVAANTAGNAALEAGKITAAQAAKAGTTGVVSAIGQQMAMDFAVGAITGGGHAGPAAQTSGYWRYDRVNQKRTGLFTKTYHLWMDQTRHEEMYGTLYSHKAPVGDELQLNFENRADLSVEINGASGTLKRFGREANKGAASDIDFSVPGNYLDATSPALLSTDNFVVQAPGISGSIKPYRLETATVAMPRSMTAYHARFSPVQHVNYKVPFVYEGSPSNAYYHQLGGASSVTSPSSFYYGYSNVLGSTTPSANSTLKFDFEDVTMGAVRIKTEVASAGHKIAQSNHIEWLSNGTIASTTAGFSNGYMDYFSGTARSTFRQSHTFGGKVAYSSSNDFTDGVIKLTATELSYFANGQTVPLTVTAYASEDDLYDGVGGIQYQESVTVSSKSTSSITVSISSTLRTNVTGKVCSIKVLSSANSKGANALGGFAITSPDGVTYHFALPVYDYDNYIKIVDNTNSAKYSEVERKEPFASTWLLTGITGPDFIDRGGAGNAANGIIDESDWGYWIKFNYAKTNDNYRYRNPYSTTDTDYNLDAAETIKTFSKGARELYYLNSIESRSHVALFLKSERTDNRGVNAAVTHKLEEILLLGREAYKKLGATTASGGFGMQLCSGITSKNWLITDFYASSGTHPLQGQYVVRNADKRVKFTYKSPTSSLCQGVPNATSGGKLTLERVSIIGRNDLKMAPDYIFHYGNNYTYNKDAWDGWGMYAPNNTQTTRGVSNINSHGAAWALEKITTPIGAEIIVDLERDRYASVSGEKFWSGPASYAGSTDSDVTNQRIPFPSPAGFNVGDEVRLQGTIKYECTGSTHEFTDEYDIEVTVTGISGGYLYYTGGTVRSIPCTTFTVNSDIGVIKRRLEKFGGNVRVKTITMKNELGQERKTMYQYNNSGVVAQEPEFVRSVIYPFYNITGYPVTPVMYGKVTVLTGNLATESDYHTKQEFEFETPHSSMVTHTKFTIANKKLITSRHVEKGFLADVDFYFNDYLTEVRNTISDRTSRIGVIKSIKSYAKNQTVPAVTTTFNYTEQLLNPGDVNNYQGYYAEGTLMFDRIAVPSEPDWDELQEDFFYKTNKTSKLNYPYALKSVTTTTDGFSTKSENKAWDLISGQILEKTNTSPLGLKTLTVIKPAYHVYPEMGSKATDSDNKNMLAQSAAVYTYRLDASSNKIGIINGTVETWKNSWNNYRVYVSGSQTFNDGDDEPSGIGIWRKDASYIYKGSYNLLNNDGTQDLTGSDQFNFQPGAANSLWQYTGSNKRFDHYSMPLESADLHGIHSVTKMGYDGRTPIAQALNAKYNEIAFSSAEDLATDKPFFGGEVMLGSAAVKYKSKNETSTTHTGDAVIALSSGYGFVYKTSLEASRRYRASVWTNSTNGRIYYKINGGGEVLSETPSSVKLVNGWYRIDVEIPMQSAAFSLEVGVESQSGQVLFDDFRFQPVDASMTCYVFPPLTFEFTASSATYLNYSYVLDNNNFYTMFESNEKGMLTKTYQESFKYGVKLISESRENLRRFHTNQ